MEHAERCDRLDSMIASDNLIRGEWTDGKDRACLLAAISPEVAEQEDAAYCPASVMPAWLAYLTPAIDDDTSIDAWPGIVRRYAALARRWHVLDSVSWKRLDYTVRDLVLAEASLHTTDDRALVAIAGVRALLARAIAGESVPALEWSASEAASRAASWAASWAASESASWAASSAASRAASSAASRAASRAASEAASLAARAASWDRMSTGILDAIEREIERAETHS